MNSNAMVWWLLDHMHINPFMSVTPKKWYDSLKIPNFGKQMRNRHQDKTNNLCSITKLFTEVSYVKMKLVQEISRHAWVNALTDILSLTPCLSQQV